MEASDDRIHETDVELSPSRELDPEPRVQPAEAGGADASSAGHGHGSRSDDDVAVENDDEPPRPRAGSDAEEARPAEERPAASDEHSECIERTGPSPAASRAKGRRKWKKRKRRNPFISFFLSMYSRRPKQRVAEVARQAGRHWGRMSDHQRKLYAYLHGFQH